MIRNCVIHITVMFFLLFISSTPVLLSVNADENRESNILFDSLRGIFFDPLDNDTYIDTSRSQGYKIENGYISIDFNESVYVYNCSNSADKIEIFFRNMSQPFFIINSMIPPETLEIIEKSMTNFDILKYRDDVYFKTKGKMFKFIPMVPIQHYRFKIDQDPDRVYSISLSWYGLFNGYKLRVFAWNCEESNGGRWELQGSISGYQENILIGKDCPSKFISEDGWIDIILIPWPSLKNDTYLWTDYIHIEVKEVSRKNATIVTNPISPEKIWKWEFVEWKGNVSKGASIKIQILNVNGDPLDDNILEGNSKGFERNVVPLPSLNGVNGIRLKFLIEVSNLPSNPRISEYIVLWQTENKIWKDDLITDFRLEKRSDTEVVSKIIYLPKGFWWEKFEAKLNLSGGGKVTFSILDEKGNSIIDDIEGKSTTIYNISRVCVKVIRIKADIKKNGSFTPKIDEWSITFSTESEKPVLRYQHVIFLGIDDVVNKKVKIKISAKDDFPGICNVSARYKLEYINNQTGYKYCSDWLLADVHGKNCSTDWVDVSTKYVPIFYDDSLKKILNLDEKVNVTLSGLWFSIEDMSGNRKETDRIAVQIDLTPPESKITTDLKDIGFKHGYEHIEISADASDDISNVKRVTLYYMVSKDNESFSAPVEYSTLENQPWIWEFLPNESGYYRFFTIAEDNAGNVEEKEGWDLSLLIDINKPDKPKFEDRIYWMNNRSIDFVEFFDDLCIESIEYKLGGEEYFEWKEIISNCGSNVYDDKWEIDWLDWEQMESGKIYPVYFKIRDLVGNEYLTPDDGDALKIAKDTIPPYPSIESDSLKLWQSRLPIKISSYIYNQDGSDISKVILLYRYSPDNKTWSDWKVYNETVFYGWYTWLFYPEEKDGYYEIKLRVFDQAGNFADSDIIKFGLTVFPEREIVVMVVVFGLFLVISALIVRRWQG